MEKLEEELSQWVQSNNSGFSIEHGQKPENI
jgi:hypothetical protein